MASPERNINAGMGSLEVIEDQVWNELGLPLNSAIEAGDITVFSNGSEAFDENGNYLGHMYGWSENNTTETT